MSSTLRAARAYQASADSRSLRSQEADIFHRANGALRAALDGSDIDRVRAVADNRRLWLTVVGVVQDPANALPPPVRAAIVSVGRTVGREMDGSTPDIRFLLAINENMIAGLSDE